jgi:predicted Zn-dependent peptidase
LPGCILLASWPALLAAQEAREFEKRVTEFTLPNGLQFLLVERHDAPVVSFHTYIRAGSADDVTGHTGLAYLTNRALFAGTENIGSRNWSEERKALDAVEETYDRLEAEQSLGPKANVSRMETLQTQVRLAIGTAERYGLSNAYKSVLDENGASKLLYNTTPDATECSYSLPSNKVELWFLMESQRLLRPALRDFYIERATVGEEAQKRTESTSQRHLLATLAAAAFQAHPYRNPVSGWPSDLAGLRRTEARAFFERYYVPGNVVISLVGDVNAGEVKTLAAKYFGSWSAKPLPPLIRTSEPPQSGPKTVTIESSGNPLAVVGYKRPSEFDKDDAAFDLLRIILGEGKGSLLQKELIGDKRLAQRADAIATFPAGRYPSLFVFVLVPSQGHTVEENQRALDEFLNRLKVQTLDVNILSRAKAQARTALLNRLAGNDGLAAMLAVSQGNYGDWHRLFNSTDEIDKVTSEDLQRVLIKYFVPSSRTTVYTVFPGQPGARLPQATGEKQ